jgi:hypothetical protein
LEYQPVSTIEATASSMWSMALDDVDWTVLEHPDLSARAQAARVKVLSRAVFLVLFPPGLTTPALTHRYDSTYFVTEGAIQFGDEAWVKANSVRAVQAGHVDGPQHAHPAVGVTFLLVSSGPIDMNWTTS